jgi:aminobenzoyl-glutamate transport protein
MMPYTVMLTLGWIILLIIWMLIGLPLGPDGPLYIPM